MIESINALIKWGKPMAKEWFLKQNGKEFGPISVAKLKILAHKKKIKPDDMVRNSDLNDWIPASKVNGLFTESPQEAVFSDELSSSDVHQSFKLSEIGSNKLKILFKPWVIIIVSIITYPIALLLIWLNPAWAKPRKILWTFISTVLFLMFYTSNQDENLSRRKTLSSTHNPSKQILKDNESKNKSSQKTTPAEKRKNKSQEKQPNKQIDSKENNNVSKKKFSPRIHYSEPSTKKTFPTNKNNNNNKNIEYKILEQDIDDSKLKVQINQSYLVETAPNETALKSLLNKLYAKSTKLSGFKNAKKANWYQIGLYISEEHYQAKSGQWIALLNMNPKLDNPRIEINKYQLVEYTNPPVKKHELTLNERKQVWKEIYFAEDQSEKDADKGLPAFQNQNPAQREVAGKKYNFFLEAYQNKICEVYEINRDELSKIMVEAVNNGWPLPDPDREKSKLADLDYSKLKNSLSKKKRKKPKKTDPEKKAKSQLIMAKNMLSIKPDIGIKRLKVIIKDYPGTTAAKEAQDLLDTN